MVGDMDGDKEGTDDETRQEQERSGRWVKCYYRWSTG